MYFQGRYRFGRSAMDWVVGISIVFVMVLVIVALVYTGYQSYKIHKKCTDNGGDWVQYNCRDNVRMSCSYDAEGHLQECHTTHYETCDEKCVGAAAEAQ